MSPESERDYNPPSLEARSRIARTHRTNPLHEPVHPCSVAASEYVATLLEANIRATETFAGRAQFERRKTGLGNTGFVKMVGYG